MAPDSVNTTGGEIAVNGRRYRLPKAPVVVVCVIKQKIHLFVLKS